MIPPSTIQAFLNRKLDDHSWMKELPEEKVDEAIASLRPRPNVNGDLLHQKVGFLLGLTYPGFYYIYDMGSGKTRLSARLLQYQYSTGFLKRWSTILVPTDNAVTGWRDELRDYFPDLPYCMLLGSSEQKWRQLENFRSGLVLVTYPGYAAMVSQIQDVWRKVRGVARKKRERVPIKELVAEFVENTDALVMDEITNLGNYKSLFFETVEPVALNARLRYGLAGRPFGRDPTITWPQFYLTDHGASLGDSLGIFREAFFEKKASYWGGPYSFEYKIGKKGPKAEKRRADLARAIAHRSLAYDIDECVTLPPLVPKVVKVEFPEETVAYYNKITESLVEARGNYREVEASFHKMRQIASGYLGFVDDETGERAQIEFKDNPKLDELIFRLDEMPVGRKALIWHEYTWTGSRICRELAVNKWKHGWLWGGTKTAEWEALKDRFDNDPDFKALVVSHKKAAFALNLQSANYEFVIESPVSPISRAQMERRARRQGQVRTVFRYDIVVRGSVEEQILLFHKEGNDLMKALIADPRKTLRV